MPWMSPLWKDFQKFWEFERGVSPPSLVHRPSMIPPGLVPPPAHLANMLSQLAAASQGVGGSSGVAPGEMLVSPGQS